MKRTAAIIGAAAALLAAAGSAHAQSYPAKPIHIVNQFNPGSGGDFIIRVVGEELARVAGQPVVVENKPGAGGMTAAVLVSNAEPDGYTLLGATAGPITTRRYLAKNTPIDTLTALKPITRVGETLILFVANEKVPAGSFKQFLEHVKQNPGKVTYGTSGIGSPHHLAGEQLKQLLGINMIHVPYKATAAALLDTVAGQISSTFTLYSVAVPHIQSGKLRVLAVRDEKRVKQLPDVPTINEIVPDFQIPPSWTGLFAPGGLSDALTKRVNALAVKAIASPFVAEKLGPTGFDASPTSAEEFASLIQKQVKLVGKIVQAAGVKAR